MTPFQHNTATTGINVKEVILTQKHSWILKNKPYSGKIAKGVIFLVAVYNAEGKLPALFKMIEASKPRPEKVIFCENNSTDKTLELIWNWKYPHEVIRFWARKDAIKVGREYDVIGAARQLLLTRARKLSPEFAIFLDDDVFPEDPNYIEKLTSHNNELVGGTYLRQFPEGIFIASKWHVNEPPRSMPQVRLLKKLVRKAQKKGHPNMIFSTCERKLYRVTMTSGGLLCIRKDLIQDGRINFFPIPEELTGMFSEDFFYCVTAKGYGYLPYLDGDTRAAHVFATETKKRAWKVNTPFSFGED